MCSSSCSRVRHLVCGLRCSLDGIPPYIQHTWECILCPQCTHRCHGHLKWAGTSQETPSNLKEVHQKGRPIHTKDETVLTNKARRGRDGVDKQCMGRTRQHRQNEVCGRQDSANKRGVPKETKERRQPSGKNQEACKLGEKEATNWEDTI
jgi:hypothetical protein